MVRTFWVILIVAIAWVGIQLWGPDGAVYREKALQENLQAALDENAVEAAKNAKLAAELYSLENKRAATEERARRELFYVRPNELLVRLETPEAASERDKSVANMPDYSHPEIPPGSAPTFRAKKDYLYFAPKNQRAPASRDKRP